MRKIRIFAAKFDIMKAILTRRTIRKYADRDVSETLLNRLMTEAARTQTMGNLQLYSVIVTRSDEMKAKLSPVHFNQPMVKEAPVVLTICADFNRTSFWAKCRKAEPGYDNFLSFINAATDALLYTQTLCNLMDEEGLGYCYLGTTVYQPQQIIDACSHTDRRLASRRAPTLRSSASGEFHPSGDLPGLSGSGYRYLLQLQGEPGGESQLCEHQPQGNPRPGVYRYPLHP